MKLSSQDPELLLAWDKLAARYPNEKRELISIVWIQRKAALVGWEYLDTAESCGDTWHTFICRDHPVFGRVLEMVPASSNWVPPIPTTWRMFGGNSP